MAPLVLLGLVGLEGCRGYLHRIEPPVVQPRPPGQEDLPPAVAWREYALARLAWSDGDLEGAQRHLLAASGLDPKSLDLSLALARLAVERGQVEQALGILEGAERRAPMDARVPLARGEALLAAGRGPEAAAVLLPLAVEGGSGRAFSLLVQARARSGDRAGVQDALARWRKVPFSETRDLWERAQGGMKAADPCGAWPDLDTVVWREGARAPYLEAFLGASRACPRHHSALARLDMLVRVEPANTRLLGHLASYAGEVGDLHRAADAWAAYLRYTDSREAPVLLPAVDALLAAARPQEAAVLLEELAPEQVPRQTRARVRAALGDGRGALALYAGDLRAGPKGPWTEDEALFLARTLQEEGRWSDAAAVLERSMADLGPRRGLALALARVRLHQGREGEAWMVLERVPPHFPGAILVDRAHLLEERGRVDEAVAVLDEADRANPDGGPLLLEEASRILLLGGRSVEAQPRIQALQDRFPQEPSVRVLAAWAAWLQGRTEEAVGLYREALALDPTDPSIQGALAFTLLDGAAPPVPVLDEALALARSALEQEPANPDFLDTLGWASFRLGRLGEAEEHLGRASRIRGDDPDILAHLAQVLRARGREADALAVEERVREIQRKGKEKR